MRINQIVFFPALGWLWKILSCRDTSSLKDIALLHNLFINHKCWVDDLSLIYQITNIITLCILCHLCRVWSTPSSLRSQLVILTIDSIYCSVRIQPKLHDRLRSNSYNWQEEWFLRISCGNFFTSDHQACMLALNFFGMFPIMENRKKEKDQRGSEKHTKHPILSSAEYIEKTNNEFPLLFH